MNEDEKRDQFKKPQISILFEICHFLLVAAFLTALLCLIPLIDDYQAKDVYYFNNWAGTLIVISPFLIFFFCYRIFKYVRPGRIFLTAVVLFIFFSAIKPPDQFPSIGGLAIHQTILIWPIFVFGFAAIVVQWKEAKRRLKIKSRMMAREAGKGLKAFPREKGEAERDVEKVRASLHEGLAAKEHLEKKFSPAKRELESSQSSPILRVLFNAFQLVIVLAVNLAFVQVIQAMGRSGDTRTRFAVYILAILYPALLYGLVFLLSRRVQIGNILLGTILSWVLMRFLLADITDIDLLGFVIFCYGLGFYWSWKKDPQRRRFALKAKKQPKNLDDDIEMRRRKDRQIERKFRSKRANTHWYGNAYYNQRR